MQTDRIWSIVEEIVVIMKIFGRALPETRH